MKILTGTTNAPVRGPSPKAPPDQPGNATCPKTESPSDGGPQPLSAAAAKKRDWREVTVNEIAVEVPQAALDVFALQGHSPALGHLAQSAVSGLAFVRAYQGLKGGSLEQKLEGASSLALGVSGVLSMIPGQVAAHSSQVFSAGQAALELTLGIRELHEELFVDETPDWKEIVTGSLDTVKGASAFVPFFFPHTANAMTGLQVAAMLAKAAFESTIHRSSDE